MQFINKIILLKVQEIRSANKTSLLPSSNDWQSSHAATAAEGGMTSSNDPISEMYSFSLILESIRDFQLTYKTKQYQTEQNALIQSSAKLFISPERGRHIKAKLMPRALFKSPSFTERLVEEPADKPKENNNNSNTMMELKDLDSIPLSFGTHHERWDRMDEAEIVKDSLLNGNVSLALSFIQWRRDKGTFSNESIASRNNLFDDFKRLACYLVYQSVCLGQIEVAVKMINHMGQNVHSHFKQIALNTTRREVRQQLLNYLTSSGYPFTEEETALLKYAALLEQLYPNPCFSQLYTTLATKQGIELDERDPHCLKFFGYDLDDLTPEVESMYGFQVCHICY
jgi:hypothetical protein